MEKILDRFWSTIEAIGGIYDESMWDIEFLFKTYNAIWDCNHLYNFNVNKNIVNDLYESVKNIEILAEDMDEVNCSNLKNIHQICTDMLEICGCSIELPSYEV